MRKFIYPLMLLVLFSCSDGGGKGGRNGTLYLRTLQWGGAYPSLDINWIFLGNDGTIVWDPVHGTNPVQLEKERRDNREHVGKYREQGDKLLVEWDNGKKEEWSYEKEGDAYSSINGGITSAPDPFPKDHIRGTYSALAFSPTLSNIQTFAFREDGSFSLGNSTAVSTEYASSNGSQEDRGTYTIEGNTLRLKYENGTEHTANIMYWDLGKGKLHLVINRTSFPPEDN